MWFPRPSSRSEAVDHEESPAPGPSTAERELSSLEARLREAFTEAERMRAINDELKADLRRLTAEAGDALAARTRAERLQRERDEARERASQERALAAADRVRAAEAERLMTDADVRARTSERRLAVVTERLRTTVEQLETLRGSLLALLGDSDVVRLEDATDPAASSILP